MDETSSGKGETSAIINMGDYYFYGEGVPYDVQTAVSWWKKIAKVQNLHAFVWECNIVKKVVILGSE